MSLLKPINWQYWGASTIFGQFTFYQNDQIVAKFESKADDWVYTLYRGASRGEAIAACEKAHRLEVAQYLREIFDRDALNALDLESRVCRNPDTPLFVRGTAYGKAEIANDLLELMQ